MMEKPSHHDVSIAFWECEFSEVNWVKQRNRGSKKGVVHQKVRARDGMELTIETERESPGRWIAEVLELSGVMLYGKSKADAVRKVKKFARQVLLGMDNQLCEALRCKNRCPVGCFTFCVLHWDSLPRYIRVRLWDSGERDDFREDHQMPGTDGWHRLFDFAMALIAKEERIPHATPVFIPAALRTTYEKAPCSGEEAP